MASSLVNSFAIPTFVRDGEGGAEFRGKNSSELECLRHSFQVFFQQPPRMHALSITSIKYERQLLMFWNAFWIIILGEVSSRGAQAPQQRGTAVGSRSGSYCWICRPHNWNRGYIGISRGFWILFKCLQVFSIVFFQLYRFVYDQSRYCTYEMT